MDSKETFHDHIIELRNRFGFVFLSVALFSTIGYVYRSKIIYFIHKPYSSPLYYNTPAGAFNLTVKISLVVGLFFTLPILLYNIIRFLEPAVSQKLEKRRINAVLVFSCILAVGGAAFAYYVLLPMSLHFFGSYSSKTISPLISANEYFNYVINMAITFAVLFQIPLIIDFINRVKPLNPRQLLKYQKYVIIGAIIIAVVLPFTYDPVSQFVVAIPIVVLFYLSIIMVAMTNRRRNKNNYTSSEDHANQPLLKPAARSRSEDDWQVSIDELLSAEQEETIYVGPSTIHKGTTLPSMSANKYFDVVPANTIEQEHMPIVKIEDLVQPNIRQIKKTSFIDGFRPINNRPEPFST